MTTTPTGAEEEGPAAIPLLAGTQIGPLTNYIIKEESDSSPEPQNLETAPIAVNLTTISLSGEKSEKISAATSNSNGDKDRD